MQVSLASEGVQPEQPAPENAIQAIPTVSSAPPEDASIVSLASADRRPAPLMTVEPILARPVVSARRRPMTASACNFSRVLRGGDARRVVPVRRRRQRAADRSSRVADASAGMAMCRASRRASATASACTARGIRARAALQSGQAAARSVRQGRSKGRSRGTRPCFRSHRDDGGRDETRTAISTAPACVPLVGRRRYHVRLGQRPAPRRPLHQTR